MNKVLLCASALAWAFMGACTNNGKEAIVDVKSYGFVDLEGAKVSAIIVEYDQEVKGSSVDATKFSITDYAILQEQQHGFEQTIETDKDDIEGNEGQITKVYVNNQPAPSSTGGTDTGKYVIIEVNTDYILTGQNLAFTTTMMAGVQQKGDIEGSRGTIAASNTEVCNYTISERMGRGGRMREVIETDKEKLILPEFAEGSGWTLNYIGNGAFKATDCYSEYTGKYEDFELPYAIFVPKQEVLENHKGNTALTIHMEHAGANDTDPMAAITSSRAAVKHAGDAVQSKQPTIVLVPQIEESRRSTNDLVASSEANTAIWELVDYILDKYKGYIDENKIYGTGQSMGGMTILNMAAQRDNFFAGVVATGAQWSNSYNKTFQNGGERTPENDTISFNGWGLDKENYQNWYYMISDDNILAQTCADDPMATALWQAVADYYAAAGKIIPYDAWSPFDKVDDQNARGKALVTHDNQQPGSGINWIGFTQGDHMSTWKYGYQLDYCFEWLYAQNRQTEMKRGKIAQLRNKWLGRDATGKIKAGSGTAGLNSAQYTPSGPDEIFNEGWTPVSATIKMIDAGSDQAKAAYEKLTDAEKAQVTNRSKIGEEEPAYLTVIDRYMSEVFGKQYAEGEHCVPIHNIVAVDKHNAADILVWGDYWVFNYNQVGDTLKCVSGGSHPGLMHLQQTDKGFEVTAFDQVGDGSSYLPTAKKIFGDKFDAFQAINSDEKKREQLRADVLTNYVKAHNLTATMYQDYGWPAHKLGD